MTNDRFREAISIDFGDLTIDDKKQLSLLMRRRNYRVKKVDGEYTNVFPSNAQLDYAWEYIKSLSTTEKISSYRKPMYSIRGYDVERDEKGRFKKWRKRR